VSGQLALAALSVASDGSCDLVHRKESRTKDIRSKLAKLLELERGHIRIDALG
jgi:hypothetical protein